MKSLTKAILFGVCVGNAAGLQIAPTGVSKTTNVASTIGSQSESTISHCSERRQFMKNILAFSAAPFLSAGVSAPAVADVSDGNALPQGAAQFGRVLRAKLDLAGVQKRVEGAASEMDKKEWDNVGQFLRKVYATSEDMKSIAAGFYDPEKKKKAASLIEDVKKYSKAADEPTGRQNGPEFVAYSKKLVSLFDEFLELLQDVPDEL